MQVRNLQAADVGRTLAALLTAPAIHSPSKGAAANAGQINASVSSARATWAARVRDTAEAAVSSAEGMAAGPEREAAIAVAVPLAMAVDGFTPEVHTHNPSARSFFSTLAALTSSLSSRLLTGRACGQGLDEQDLLLVAPHLQHRRSYKHALTFQLQTFTSLLLFECKQSARVWIGPPH